MSDEELREQRRTQRFPRLKEPKELYDLVDPTYDDYIEELCFELIDEILKRYELKPKLVPNRTT